jgi:hypothetical protein
MNNTAKFAPVSLLAVGIGIGLALGGALRLFNPLVSQGYGQQQPAPKPASASPLLDAQALSDRVPDQSHAMVDVGYHFANLWFAADKENWPLAAYYLSGTRSHLKWAVRIHPVRQTKAGDVDLNGIAEAVDNTFLADVGKAIESKDSAKFKAAYRQTLQGCYACHTASEKPFLRPQVPETPGAPIINPDPSADRP